MDNSAAEATPTSLGTAAPKGAADTTDMPSTDIKGKQIAATTGDDTKDDVTAAQTETADNATHPPEHNKKQQEQAQEEQQRPPSQQPPSFTQAVFPGFVPPKITTPAFFSSMQGKIQSTLAGAKSPTIHLQPPQIPQINKVDMKQLQVSTEQLANTTKDWGVSAFKSLSNAAQRVSANVTQGIQKEHDEFVRQKKMETVVPRQGTESVPAWAGLPNEEKIKARMLSLSKDKRNFLLPPPPGTDFVFDMNAYSSMAVATLRQDPNLDKMRFFLVPKEVEELVFWRNYFYRISLLKQVALAAASGGPDTLADAASEATATGASVGSGESGHSSSSGSNSNGNNGDHRKSQILGYNIYFGKDDVEGPPRRSRPSSANAKDMTASTAGAAAGKDAVKAPVTKSEKKPEVLFEAEMPDHDEDPDAWLEKQLASGVSISGGDEDDAEVDVADWEKELQNELKDYVEES
ncbi:hypothetical protein EDD11_006145 [Mortierella claussenii]|nr:hypothetical protein EDD11_006145 [Mortierella claussenii]